MKFKLLLIILFAGFFISPHLRAEELKDNDHHYVESEVRQRINQMHVPVSIYYNGTVRGIIRHYVKRHRDASETILGRSSVYFPMFEKYLKEYNLPDALKFLPVVESALKPDAVSRVGATGLWQFMRRTGKSFGLKIDSYVDERKDPVKSTIAAMEYLTELYDTFGDWNLALAAYNAGPGRVYQAIKKGKSRNYWVIRKHLPKETQSYVPAFIAAAYLMNYHQFHDLNAEYPDYDLQFTETIEIKEYTTFKKVSQASGIDVDLIKKLNPAYAKGYMPFNKEGNYLILPKHGMIAYREFHNLLDDISYLDQDEENLFEQFKDSEAESYIVQPGDTLELVAERFQLPVEHIISWNQLSGNKELDDGQALTLYIAR